MVKNALGHELKLGHVVTTINESSVDTVDVGYIYELNPQGVSVQWVAEIDGAGSTILRKDLPPEKVSPLKLIKPNLPLDDKIMTAVLDSLYGV